jgi:hypothetical protein
LSVLDNPISTSDIQIYPNPVTDSFWLQVKNRNEKFEIGVYDINGRLIKIFSKYIEDKILIDVSDLTKGFYTIHIKTNKGSISTKFIKE